MKSKNITARQVKPLIFGIASTIILDDEREFFAANLIFGFILFKRNIESATQLQNLVKDLRNIDPKRQIYIFIDQEGGRVARLKPPIISKEYPPGDYFGKIYDKQGAMKACEAARKNYYELVKDLKSYNIDSPCAPVADLTFSYTDDVIGDRSFSSEPEKVTQLCKAAVQGIAEAGGLAIIKHIPGHGRATCDSHFELPRVEAPLSELELTDFVIFKELAKDNNISFAMTAHIIFDALDRDYPVTISAKAIQYIREKIGFTGQLITDDLSMLALHGKIGEDYYLLKKAIKSINDKGVFDFNNLKKIEDFDQQIWYLTENEQIYHLTSLLEAAKQAYLESLESVTKQATEAGCDLIMHCSGDLAEMIAIAGVFNSAAYN